MIGRTQPSVKLQKSNTKLSEKELAALAIFGERVAQDSDYMMNFEDGETREL